MDCETESVSPSQITKNDAMLRLHACHLSHSPIGVNVKFVKQLFRLPVSMYTTSACYLSGSL